MSLGRWPTKERSRGTDANASAQLPVDRRRRVRDNRHPRLRPRRRSQILGPQPPALAPRLPGQIMPLARFRWRIPMSAPRDLMALSESFPDMVRRYTGYVKTAGKEMAKKALPNEVPDDL